MTPLRLLLFFGIALTSVAAFSQQNGTVKVYTHLAVNGARGVPIIDQPNASLLQYKWVSPALHIEFDSGRYHEFELTNLLLQTAPTDEVDTRFSFGLKYERGRNFNFKKNGPLRFLTGISCRAYYGMEQLNQSGPNGIPSENNVIGLALAINPHLEYKLFKNLAFDFSPYCEAINFAVRRELVFDEFLVDEQQDSIDFYLLKLQFFLRFGLAWRF
ncbi:MAG: hypothetical protein IT258_14565 [Saprospiraceae bacterium]|nr:hypothetical protein [Saprospiraceae bacterium]